MKTLRARRTRSVWISTLLFSSACGSRSALLDPVTETGSTLDPCAPPEISAACADKIAQAEAGSELWSATFDLGALSLIGPVAADSEGGTYYVAAESSLYAKTIHALDACGALRWSADVSSLVAASGYVTQVMVAGGHLLVVGVGNIVALDLESGAHAWTADLDGFGKGGGLGVPPGKLIATGYAAARADGTVYTTIANDLDEWIVSVSREAKIHPVAKVEHYLSGAGYPFYAQQLVIDAAGHIVFAGGASSGSGEPIRAFGPDGEIVYSTTLPSWGIGQSLAAGPDFVTGRSLWILGLDGELRNDFTGGGPTFVSWDGPTAIDVDGTLYVAGGQHLDPGVSTVTYDLLGRFTPDGDPVWSLTLEQPIFSGPVLGDGERLFVVTSEGFEPGSATHLGAYGTDGSLVWETPLGPSGKLPSYWMLQNAAGALVVAIDGHVRAFASGGSKPKACASWPTPRGDIGQRVCASGK